MTLQVLNNRYVWYRPSSGGRTGTRQALATSLTRLQSWNAARMMENRLWIINTSGRSFIKSNSDKAELFHSVFILQNRHAVTDRTDCRNNSTDCKHSSSVRRSEMDRSLVMNELRWLWHSQGQETKHVQLPQEEEDEEEEESGSFRFSCEIKTRTRETRSWRGQVMHIHGVYYSMFCFY